jgi:hypothetical protein
MEINTGEEGAAAVSFGGLSEYLARFWHHVMLRASLIRVARENENGLLEAGFKCRYSRGMKAPWARPPLFIWCRGQHRELLTVEAS